jgi:two-component system nitrogen regulation sensor histidine kinase NtrY
VRSIFGGKYRWLWLSVSLLLVALAFRYFFIVKQNTQHENARVVTEKLTREIAVNQPVIGQLKDILIQNQNPSFNTLLIDTKYPYYIFSNKISIFWSKSDFTPNYRDLLGDFSLGYVKTVRGKFIAQKEAFMHQQRLYEIVFMIPLTEEFSIVNKYLKNTHNSQIFTDLNFEITHQSTQSEFEPILIGEKELFSIHFGNTYANSEVSERNVLVVLILLAFAALFIFVKEVLAGYVKHGEIFQGFFFLFLSIISLRSLMLLLNFPFDFVYIDIFDPRHYGSTVVNSSLGDLLLNLVSLMLIGLYVFSNFLSPQIIRKVLREGPRRKLIISVACFFFSLFWLAVHHQVMKTLNFDSQWSMDITQKLEFEYLKAVAYGMFFISVIIYFLFVHVCFRVFNQLNLKHDKNFYTAVFLGLLIFVGFALVLNWDFEVVVVLNFIFFFIVRYFSLHRYLGKLQYLTFIYFFSFGLPGALIGVYANFQFNMNNTDYNKSRLATQLLIERNFFTEMQLGNIARMIKEDSYIKQRIYSPFASKKFLEKKIESEFLTNLDQFEVQIFVFNSRGEVFEEFGQKDNFRVIKSRNRGNETDTEGLYFLAPGPGQATVKYLSFIEIEYRDQVIGYILLELKQKRLVPNSVFPLLINESSYSQQIENPDQFSYCVFANKQLQYSSGPFNYRRYLSEIIQDTDDIFEESSSAEGYSHKAFLGENDRFVIVSAKELSLNQRLANFSFLFLVFIFAILMILISIAIYQSIKQIRLNYAAKIQLYLNIAFFTPLIIVSVTTISIILQSFKASLESQYLEYAENLSALIADPLNDFRSVDIDPETLSEQLYQMAEVADVDMNIFNTNGRLIASSLFQVYQNSILSYNIAPNAFIRIFENQESAFVQEEKVGLLEYKNVYVGVRSPETGTIIGILSLPFFASKKDLEQSIIDVLSYIINIFTFLFVIFLVVSFFVSRGLTFPLWLITQKIKRTTLSSFNEPLSWNSDDEIGLMVAEYNRMLVNLEESKKALAKSEKESAWREMARQVAHEIKNPLTPMKLTLQHMKRIIDDAEDNGETEKKQKQINSLLEQIETLSDIATSFSDFAKMPIPQIESLDIRVLLLETIELYNKKELGKIVPDIEGGDFEIKGDKKWLGRALSNLIINGFQAVNDDRKAILHIRLLHEGLHRVRIEIEDNGAGIPVHIGEQVFTPNFSTKYTGSGLGLAITKKGIEHADGSIWFESKEGEGTVFYIELPLA